MTIFELSLFTAVGFIVLFTLGFLFGIGYQKTEDMRKLRRREAEIEQMRKDKERIVKELKDEKKRQSDEEWRRLLEDTSILPWEDQDIKFGD